VVIRNTFRALLAVLVFSGWCVGQSTPAQKPADAPCPIAGQSSDKAAAKPCTPPASDTKKPASETKKPSAAEQFPFPGEAAKPAAAPDAPGVNAPTPSGAHPSAASEHPFPSDADSSSSSSSSGNSSSSSSDDVDDPTAPTGPPLHDEGSEGKSTRRKLPKVQRVQTDDERVDEDLSVARFYVNDGNLQGAYLRAKDAVKLQPDYSETHFVLGEVAQKLKKRDEAIAEFNTYLKLDPKGEKIKAAQRALAELQ
jgi:tetratricopeptide (TPR) repeat protein